jgi:hypothetical protein
MQHSYTHPFLCLPPHSGLRRSVRSEIISFVRGKKGLCHSSSDNYTLFKCKSKSSEPKNAPRKRPALVLIALSSLAGLSHTYPHEKFCLCETKRTGSTTPHNRPHVTIPAPLRILPFPQQRLTEQTLARRRRREPRGGVGCGVKRKTHLWFLTSRGVQWIDTSRHFYYV